MNIPSPSWCVVQTQEQGRFVLSSVPYQWVSGSNLYWPNVKNSDILDYLLKDGNSVPLPTWNRLKCSVKRINCKSYEEALISEMSDSLNTDSDVSSRQRATPETNIRNTYSKLIKSLHESNSENLNLLSSPRRHVQNNQVKSVPTFPAGNKQQDDHVHPTTSYSSIQRSISSTDIPPTTVVSENIIQLIQTIDQESNKRHQELLKILAGLETKVERLFSMSRNTMAQRKNAREVFDFKPVETKEGLDALERNLHNDLFKQKFIDYMQSRCVGIENSINKMYTLIDCFFTRQFQNHCTWTGSSPKGPKHAIMVCKNVCSVFLEASRCDTELISQTHVEKFFKDVLKNSNKRMKRRCIRRSSKHHFAKKLKEDKLERPKQVSTGGHFNEILKEEVIFIEDVLKNEEVTLNDAFDNDNGVLYENDILKRIPPGDNNESFEEDTDDNF